MNWEATKLVQGREEEVERLGGLAAYRLQALQNLKLKTVVKVGDGCWAAKQQCCAAPLPPLPPPPPLLPSHRRRHVLPQESHASPVHTLVVNHTDPQLANLFATVGKDQATVYDDEHMGDHVAVACHFTNAPAEHAPGGELTAACWLSAAGWTDQPAGDACLAVAGADVNISGAQPLLLSSQPACLSARQPIWGSMLCCRPPMLRHPSRSPQHTVTLLLLLLLQ
jgi:hypothetical protein